MKVLVMGNGGREHVLVRKLLESPQVDKVFCSPGNGGTADLAENISFSDSREFETQIQWVKDNDIGLTIAGPEQPLVDGAGDSFRKAGLSFFGPNNDGAMLEGSKEFAKKIMESYKIPTAEYKVFTDASKAIEYIANCEIPVVVKADGLAAGKGVSVCMTRQEAKQAVRESLMDNRFGEAGTRVVVEEFMTGEEASVLAFTDGNTVLPMIPAQDHKNIFEGDKGPNTGGMGAYAPAFLVTPEIQNTVMKTILQPLVNGLREKGIDYRGILYAGLMLTNQGPKVVEFNCRFGDPEVQTVLPGLKNDFVDIILAIEKKELHTVDLEWDGFHRGCVVLASGGYPGFYEKGRKISGLENISGNVSVYHAGTRKENGEYFTAGGRVLNVVGTGKSLKDALNEAYAAIKKISFEGMTYRKDIGWKALRKI